ncbi:bifunctional [glutamine synthetase] adenylyltransferase/[glutamine synthetase]-adenylyl-L-tyrosine phosphorylase [Amnibacterium setariae]|uniref:Bifunctional [glutamine synthetase] adenylyltransferase/[glutamine synthetase]-adenylyl-L-tyrosine phosphorylase n=1 Tax=Amnibacterium setariae TaxID=2306585 RepID=A0A3A1U2L4_9MICO|nr:bifunctional [glutamine synthetase] adenylyltransferase/[glutamine synthetase]-adenylyl-L-tyrosine phosphorylase [Amnibacterium setariae]RIX28097.1 bifunctional [glutamine synthetase] adenylyltransferase/[glutamine synthetase]-adenylyl-L-tyrosine phosphorylase [Amnibacterium setariae]
MSSPATSSSSDAAPPRRDRTGRAIGGDELRLTDLARAGFSDLTCARAAIEDLADRVGLPRTTVLAAFDRPVGAPDEALQALDRLVEKAPEAVGALLAEPAAARRTALVLGASSGIADFLLRRPDALEVLQQAVPGPQAPEALREALLASVGAVDGVAAVTAHEARRALRAAYRRELTRLAAWDLEQRSGTAVFERVAAALSDLAAAALEAALAVARAEVAATGGADRVRAVPLAVIGMGKAGARELNYVSDVDVIFVTDRVDPESDVDPVPLATRLAIAMMRVIDDTDVEPSLWQVDANLRPEGRNGALVRTLASHVGYYERWASGWEFQALLKAWPLAGDLDLGRRYLEAVRPKVWQASGRGDFVQDVQRMRQRVEQHIPAGQTDRQLKLGPGGLRDVEFTVQLLQLVHGRTDDRVHARATLPALRALTERGYVGRVEAAEFGEDYRVLRLVEHRIQLRRLQRTHLLPTDDAELRVVARTSGLAPDGPDLVERIARVRGRVRGLHQRLFYRPLLTAVSRLPEDELMLTPEAATDRLAGIGFLDARGALAHIAALTSGVSRRASIQRTLLPVLLQWFAEGPAPDMGLLAFRRLSERLGDTAWYLRMLRDSPTAARRLATVLSESRFVVGLLETNPEAAVWLERDADLKPRPRSALRSETTATVLRHPVRDDAAAALRQARRREVLRLALGALLGTISVQELGPALADVTTAVLAGAVRSVRRDDGPWPEFAIIAMGRYGGAELGFGSDADVLAVYRPIAGMPDDVAQKQAATLVAEVKRLTTDPRLPLDLDFDLRPEGRNGPVVRSFRSYEAYYARWSLTWESQALLRARGVAGDRTLVEDFEALADRMRYPASLDDGAVREIRRIKARMETERLPRGVDRERHLKLGPGGLSDVEWIVQLLQLQAGATVPGLRTQSTLDALDAAVGAGLIDRDDAAQLRAAWVLASRLRSAITLWTNRTSDLLPTDRGALEGIARILEYPPGSAAQLEDDLLKATRRARTIFERLFT